MLYDLNGTGQDVHLRMSAMALNSYCVPSKLIISISSKNATHSNFISLEYAKSCCTRAGTDWKQVTKVVHSRIQEHSA